MIAALILAAGGSTRMGTVIPKQLLRFQGKSLLRRAVDTAAEVPVDLTVVVLGHEADRMLPELQGTDATVVLNEHWQEGLSTSLRGGLMAMPSDVRGVYIYPADMPFVTPEALRELSRRQQATGRPAAMAEVRDVRGVPVYVTRSLFPPLMIQEGDTGGATYFRTHPDVVEGVRFDETEVMRDIDRPEDFRRLQELDPDFDPDAELTRAGATPE